VSDYQGNYYPTDGRETMASNGLIHQALMREFEQIFAGRGLEALPDPRQPRT